MKGNSLRLNQLGDRLALVALHVEQHEIRLARTGAGGHLRHQRILHAVERHQQKRSQADRQRYRGRLVIRTM